MQVTLERQQRSTILASIFKARLYKSMLCLTGLLLCLPVVSITYAPLVDYPNHLARAYILYHYDDVAVYQQMYRRAVELLPNLAGDLIIPFLLSFFSILTASKVFLGLTVLLFVAGCHLLGKAIHGQPTWLALPCSFFVYNSMLLYGYVNYVFSLGLFCIALACWLRWREKWTKSRLLLATALAVCAYLAHLSSFFFLTGALVAVTAWDYLTGKKTSRVAALGLAPILPPLVISLAFMPKTWGAGQVTWNTVSGKFIGALSLMLSYDYGLDLLLMVSVLIILAVLGGRLRHVRVAWPLFTAGAFFLLIYLLSPKELFNTYGSADARFIPPAVLLVVLSLKLDVPARTGKLLLTAILIVSSVRLVSIWATWAGLDARVAAEVERLMILPEGAKVYPVFMMKSDLSESKTERSFQHIVHYATINRHAFIPTLFALEGQHPLRFRAGTEQVTSLDSDPARWIERLPGYDYVWGYGLDQAVEQLLQDRCTFINGSDGFTLWRVK